MFSGSSHNRCHQKKRQSEEIMKMIKNKMINKKNDRNRALKNLIFSMVFVTVITIYSPVWASDAANVVVGKFTAFQDLLGGIISSVGSIITLWGISEWGISFQGSEGTMQANAFKRIAGGFVMAMAPQILTAIM